MFEKTKKGTTKMVVPVGWGRVEVNLHRVDVYGFQITHILVLKLCTLSAKHQRSGVERSGFFLIFFEIPHQPIRGKLPV